MRYVLCLPPILFLIVFSSLLQATIIHVPGDQPTIQRGILACEDGDTVLVADGTYTGDGNRDIDFGGRAIMVMSENGSEVTIIDCEGDSLNQHRGFYFHSGEDSTSVLQGFTITNGYILDISNGSGGGIYNEGDSNPTVTNCTFNGNYAGYGGGMRNYQSSPSVINCVFIGNSAYYRGGGMSNFDNSNPVIINCTFSGNWAWAGGGMYSYRSNPTVTNCMFIENTADSASSGGGMYNEDISNPIVTNCTFNGNYAGYGGGMRNARSGCNPSVSNCVFIGNSAYYRGGGMDNWYGANPTVTNCLFLGNSVYLRGGGMFNRENANPTVTNCTFSGNSAGLDGGGMYNYSCSPTLTNNTFNENHANSNGGGMRNEYSNPTVTNCVFSGNSAGLHGGGMNNQNIMSPIVTNCTFTENSADEGSGMYNSVFSSPTVKNCIFWGDLSDEIYNHFSSSSIITYCNVQGGYPGEGNIDIPPRFADPDYHLQSTSPCVDSGDSTILDACLPPGSGAERSDMGAYGGEENCGWPEDLVELTIDPTGSITIHKGDTLYFSTLIRNNGPITLEGDFWLSILLPNSNEVVIPGEFLNYPNPLSGRIPPDNSFTMSYELFVPVWVSVGSYRLVGRVGLYPNTSSDEWWLDFQVSDHW